ncbi:putative Ig domain-containing protein [Parazoarcus communis]|uniref:putative Ig domain-containing protein n=1 Tax=Parazoarcus communis TaxID=41977 RepID=UPI001459578D
MAPPLPAWLAFDVATGTFSGTPAVAGDFSLQVNATDLAGSSASQTFVFAVAASGNLPPVTTQDIGEVSEDCKLFAWGNVLKNDRDPEGDKLKVTDAGLHQGEYGWLALLSNGGYAYVLNNASAKVQGLAGGQQVVDRFTYTASDGVATSTGELAMLVRGSNDAPRLVKALSDVQLAKGQAFSWQVPEGSFVDLDRTDSLTFAASLSNGRALPSWLAFDPVAQTFSGTVPSGSTAAIDVKVVATDGHGVYSTASDVFQVRIGNKTVLPAASRGSEGVGNGAGAPLPGQVANQNDSAETSQGNPVNKGKQEDLLDRFLDGFKLDTKTAVSHASVSLLDARWFERWLSPPAAESGVVTSPSSGAAMEAHWQDLLHALSRLDTERQEASLWKGKALGADITGLAGLLSANTVTLRANSDAVGLAVGSQLKGFAGLREGLAAPGN